MIDPSLGWVLEHTVGINDSGYIIGFGPLNGEEGRFLLTPIPEPVTFFLMVIPVLLNRKWLRV